MRREIRLGDARDFPPGTHRVVQVDGREIGVFNINGELYGLPNICPHQIGPLCEGKVSGTLTATLESEWKPQWVHEGEIVTCPWHGLEFHVPTGQCLAFRHITLRRYDVSVREGQVLLHL